MRDVIAEAADELHRVAAGGDDVAEIHHDADVVARLVEAAR